MSANNMPERIWYHSDGAYLPYQPTMHWEWQEYRRADLCASEQQVRALDPRIYRLNAEALAEIKATVDGESDQYVGHIIYGLLDEIAALTPAPQPSAATPTAQEAVPVAWRYRYVDPVSGKPIWRYSYNLWNGQRPSESQPLYAHPPQPSEAVAACETVLICAQEMCKAGHPVSAFNVATDALRALKGEE